MIHLQKYLLPALSYLITKYGVPSRILNVEIAQIISNLKPLSLKETL